MGEQSRSGTADGRATDAWAEQVMSSRALVARAVPGGCVGPVTRAVDAVAGLRECAGIYARTRRAMAEGRPFPDATMEAMGVAVRASRADVERIPVKGALVVAANHPFGGVEGVALLSLIGRVRPDVKILANEMLAVMPEIRPHMIALDVFGGEAAAGKNRAGMREALSHLKAGGCVIVFPAGEVSHFSLREFRVTDSVWQRGVGLLVRKSASAVLPVYVPGSNGVAFNVAGLIHPRLRTALLPRCLAARSNKTMEIRVGTPIGAKRLAELADGDTGGHDDAQVMEYLRRRVYMLAHRPPETETVEAIKPTTGEPVIAETPAADLERDIAGLPEDALLVPGEEYRAYVARPRQIPNVLREIGRLREITFRAVGEGTGKPLDLDDFDNHYLHLFVWHAKDRRVVGAYRLGRVDLILRAKGKKGLYTNTLFDYPESLLREMGGERGGALEMGRSFVRSEYQRSHQPLLMLWKGIGSFVVRNPRYHTLFGPVSVSGAYALASRHLIVKFLSLTGLRHERADEVRARSPFKSPKFTPGRWMGDDMAALARILRDADDVSEVVADFEPDAKGIPVLLSQYLKLGARVLSFNVDHDFGGCLDALVTVDLRKCDRKLLKRYAGEAGMKQFLAAHGVREPEAAPAR